MSRALSAVTLSLAVLLAVAPADATPCLYAAHPFLDAVSVVDLSGGKPIGSLPLAGPYRAETRPGGDVYVAANAVDGSQVLTRIDPTTAAIADIIPVAAGEPADIVFSADGLIAALPFWHGAARLSLFDPDTRTFQSILPRVNDDAIGVAFATALSSDRRTAFVTVPPDNVVQVIDLVAGTVTEQIPFPDEYRARTIALSPDDRTAYVTAPPTSPGVPNSTTSGPGRIAVLDAATRTIRDWIDLPEAPERIALTPDGRTAFVTYPNGPGLGVIDLASGDVGLVAITGAVIDVTVAADGQRAYASATQLDGRATLTVVDIATRTVLATIRIQDHAEGLALADVDGPCGVPPAACASDCDGDGAVEVSEILTGVAAAMDHHQLKRCRAADSDWDGDVSVAELLRGVDSALDGCQ